MKRIKLLAIIVFSFNSLLVNAQTSKGKILVGASSNFGLTGSGSDFMTVGFSTAKDKSDASGSGQSEKQKSTSLNLVPKVGYFIADNLALGLDFNLGFSSNRSEDSEFKSNQTIFTVGPFVRYYIPTSSILPFLELSGSFGSAKTKNEYGSPFIDDSEFVASIVTFGGGAGVALPLGEKVTFDVSAGYYSTTIKDKEDNPDNDRTVIGTLGLKLGFTVFLGAD